MRQKKAETATKGFGMTNLSLYPISNNCIITISNDKRADMCDSSPGCGRKAETATKRFGITHLSLSIPGFPPTPLPTLISHVRCNRNSIRKAACGKIFFHVKKIRENWKQNTHEWVVSQIWMSRVADVYVSCCTYKWVTLYSWVSHVARVMKLCCIYE